MTTPEALLFALLTAAHLQRGGEWNAFRCLWPMEVRVRGVEAARRTLLRLGFGDLFQAIGAHRAALRSRGSE